MGSFKEALLKSMNKLFPLPVHPFNLQKDGVKTYADWEFEKGLSTLQYFLDFTDLDQLFKDKTVLDIGCGAAGKTVFYATCGVKEIYGVDKVEKYKEQAERLAKSKGVEDKFHFVIADAATLPFSENTFDTIIMNDFMEHASQPQNVLLECYRVLKPGGMLYVNSPPYYHPYGAHLSDLIGVPWVHVFFGGGFSRIPNTISLSHSLRCSLRSRVWCVLRVKPVCPPGQNSVQTAASLLWKRRTGVLNAIMRSAKEQSSVLNAEKSRR